MDKINMKKAWKHYLQLPPHAVGRDTAVYLKQALDTIDEMRAKTGPSEVSSTAWLDAENDFFAYMTHWRNRLTDEEQNGDSISQAFCRASYCAAKDLLGKLRYYRSQASNAKITNEQ